LVDSSAEPGVHTSIAVGVDTLPLITYGDESHLKVVHCSNVFCVPYFRRR
jgi:hypothetical protein